MGFMTDDVISSRILKSAEPVVSLRASLVGLRPEVWRRLVMRSGSTLLDVHRALQAVFEWSDYHLYEFNIDGQVYDCEATNLSSATLAEVVSREIKTFHYLYDFGDRWHVTIDVEDAGRAGNHAYPRLVGAGRNAPPEDVGGISGYETYVKTLKSGTSSERKELLAWRGKFDPVNVNLSRIRNGFQIYGGSVAPGADQTGDKGSSVVSDFF